MATRIIEATAADWTATLAGKSLPWTRIEFTLEQFHVPAQFSIECPLSLLDVDTLLADKAPEVVIRFKEAEVFVGVVEDSNASSTMGDGLDDSNEDILNLSGRDLSGRLTLSKVVGALPQNQTASGMVALLCKEVGFTDVSGIQPTHNQVGEFVKENFNHVTQRMTRYDVIHDLAEHEHMVFRVQGRRPFFGVQPTPTQTRTFEYQKHFNTYQWTKNHTNSDVQVRILSWIAAKKQRIVETAGEGSLLIQRSVPGINAKQAQDMAKRLLERAERGLVTLNITNLPGDPTLLDILFAFRIVGIAKGLDGTYWPSRIHHVITQDDHVMDLNLYNAQRILA